MENNILYKYMPLRVEFFDNFYLRATRREDLNDPFELLPSNIALIEERCQCGNTKINSREVNEHLINECRLADRIYEDFPVFNNTGIISFTTEDKNILMWSHYADSHKGMVIGFDASHSFFCNPKPYDSYTGKLHEVDYSKERPHDIMNNAKSLFTTKAEDWAYENEYRLIVDLNDTSQAYKGTISESTKHKLEQLMHIFEKNLIYMFRIPTEAILSVTFGAKVDCNMRDNIMDKVLKNDNLSHLTVNQSVLDDNDYLVHTY